jgi:hypothetical protein
MHQTHKLPLLNEEMDVIVRICKGIVDDAPHGVVCPCCGSDKTYRTEAVHCTRCAVTTEM